MAQAGIDRAGRDVVAVFRAACAGSGILVCGCAGGSASAPRVTTPLVVTSADLTPSSDGGPASVSPQLLEPHRLSGEKRVVPDDDTKHAIARSVGRVVGSFRFCLDVGGQPTSVDLVQTTRIPSYDERIMSSIRRWVFTPVVLDGDPIPVCSVVTFIFVAR